MLSILEISVLNTCIFIVCLSSVITNVIVYFIFSANVFSDTLDNINGDVHIALANENKSPLRDSLEEFVLLEKYFEEEEKRRQEQLINMKPEEKLDCADILRCGTEVKRLNDSDVMKPVKGRVPINDKETKKAAALKENNATEGRLIKMHPT